MPSTDGLRHGPGAFVVSTGRSGSTLLSSLLRDHPAVLSLSEFFSMLAGPRVFELGDSSGRALLEFLSTPQLELEAALGWGPIPELLADVSLSGAERARSLQQLAPPRLVTLPHLTTRPDGLFTLIARVLEAAPVRPVSAHLTAVFASLCRAMERAVWVERSGGSAEYAGRLLREWPEARALFLVRDGLACARSMARHPLFRLRVGRLLHGERAEASTVLRVQLPLDRFAAYWSAVMREALKTFERCRERGLVVCYERLLAEPHRELARIAEFLALPDDLTAAWIERSLSSIRSPQNSDAMDQADRAALPSLRPGLRCLDQFRRHAGA